MNRSFKLLFRSLIMFLLSFSLCVSSTLSIAAITRRDFYQLENYILPSSNKVRLTEKDLFHLSIYNIDVARNEIYARHGYVFKNQTYTDIFTGKPWYKRNPKFKESDLSSIERKNVEFLLSYTNRLKANFKKIEGSHYSIDLNGDGKKDKINLSCNPGDYEFKLAINTSSISGRGDNLDGVMYLADINNRDNIKEIALTESGPSNDSKTYFYYYDGSKIVYMGSVQGDNYSLKLNGSGRFITKTRGSILQTWFYSDEYKLSSSHQLSHITESYRKMNTIVTVKKQLTLQKSQTDPAAAVTLNAGEKVLLSDTDDVKWCSIETADGKKGWFSTTGFSEINRSPATDYFEGLCMAD